ncbi:MAG: hypothetical protein U0002_20415 [Thermoanaerobaculia bacterium]
MGALRAARLGRPGRAALERPREAQPVFGDGSAPVEPAGVLEDLLVLPPVAAELSTWREEVAGRHLERGTPLLLQLLPGEPLPALPAIAVYDLLGALVRGEREAFDAAAGRSGRRLAAPARRLGRPRTLARGL